ncbi:hypothetical protein B296_00013635 [Ensete ventricosum]|uniref:non-specific serine/threonine protein kinase n=1 Tax=Ensete ventricosum TaxID=4639 RepID=A0A427B0A8_ENSVE|nr:hypothetical protein B296_00013635 [Ensete ventricosum]
MASSTIGEPLSEPVGQDVGLPSRRPSSWQIPKPSNLEHNTASRLPKLVQEETSMHGTTEVLEGQELHHLHNGPIEPSIDGISSKKTEQSGASYLNAISDDLKQLSVQGEPMVLPRLNETVSLEANRGTEKENSERHSMKENSVSAKVSDGTNSLRKTSGSAKISDRIESGKNSMCRASTSSDVSNESTGSSISSTINKPHKANDSRWEAIQAIRARDGGFGLGHFRLLKRLGSGDIGTVYLSELTGTKCYFAMKVMDKVSLASRKKLLRAQMERDILQCLDHPFLPTLFYISEVLLALEYLHMLGIIYRDLKPENVLVREDGHIMLSDFDLSLRCAVSPTLIKSSTPDSESFRRNNPVYCVQPVCIEPSCVQPSCVAPTTCFSPRLFSSKSKKARKQKLEIGNQISPLPELIAEPTDARSMSFVGTHEYLAPEIIKGEGHGSAVDWWTFGIFLYELLFGKTPFKGSGNRATLFNVIGQPLRFPEFPVVSFSARDLIRGLLVKEPQHRLAYKRGATEIKQHPFFEGVNWALIRCASPPEVPKPIVTEQTMGPVASTSQKAKTSFEKGSDNYLEFDFF